MIKVSALLLLSTAMAATAASPPPPAPTGLMCELLSHPEKTEITDAKPEFSWIVGAAVRNCNQSAYQIQVQKGMGANSRPALVWDSGKVSSDASTGVEYGGNPLAAGDYSWRIRTWNNPGGSSPWSSFQQFRVRVRGTLDKRYSGVRYPIQQTRVAPTLVRKLGDNRYLLDFGRAAFAGLTLQVDSPDAGRKLLVHLGEVLESPSRINRKPGGSIRYHRVEVALAAGTHTYQIPLGPKDGRLMTPEIGPVMPFRYVEVENCPSELNAETAQQLAAHYPFDDAAASFRCSDRRLEQVWELCRYSMKATSFGGVYIDGDRERLPYEADAYINQLGHYSVDREFSLARYSHEYLMLHATWPTEWSLHSVLMAHADYMYTGDKESLKEFYPDLKAKTLRVLARGDGLISTVQPPVGKEVLESIHLDRAIKDIVDWPLAERDGYEMRPINTVVNAFHYRTLVLMSEIAAAVENAPDAAYYRSIAGQTHSAINSKLFDSKTGLYLDGEGSTHSSLHANLFPLAFGLVPPERQPKVIAFIKSKGMACSVYAAQYLLEALYNAGEGEFARKLITAPGDRSWAHMLDVGTTITLEAWDNKFKPNQDWNHAWGAAPANLIPRRLLGVEPLAPGFRRFRVRPQLGGLEYASAVIPTIRGSINIEVRDLKNRLELDLAVPPNTAAQVLLPKAYQAKQIRLDGKQVSFRETADGYLLENVGSGRHAIVLVP